MPKTRVKLLEQQEKDLVSSGAEKKGLIITVSGISGSGKSTVVQLLQKAFPELKLVHAGGIFRENAKRLGMTLEEYSAKRDEEDDLQIDQETLKRSIPGNVIADGRVSAWVMGDWADLKIFVTCPLGTRIERVAKRENISIPSARNKVESRDSTDSRRYLVLYRIDVNDLGIYDIIIDNSGNMAELEKGVKKIVEKIKNSF